MPNLGLDGLIRDVLKPYHKLHCRLLIFCESLNRMCMFKCHIRGEEEFTGDKFTAGYAYDKQFI